MPAGRIGPTTLANVAAELAVAGKRRDRPVRGRSPRPSNPYRQQRCRHLRPVSTDRPRVWAIAALDASSAAASAIRARSTSRCSPLARRLGQQQPPLPVAEKPTTWRGQGELRKGVLPRGVGDASVRRFSWDLERWSSVR